MATYVNNLRLKEIGTGDESGTWGASTNTNLELLGEALGFGTEGITTNADTHATTVADGSADAGRAVYIIYTGTLDSACTITIGPNTMKRVHIIKNGTSGAQNILIKQGSGATITIPNGDTKIVSLDGAGSGAAVTDVFASLSVVDLKVQDDLTVTDDLIVNGDIDLEGDIDVNGTLEADAITLNTVAITATATLATGISNNNVPKFTTGVADDDFLRVAGTAIEGRSAAEVLSDIGASAVAGSGSIVTTGALNSGTITSGFGTINNGASTITTTGTVATGAITAGGDLTRGGTVIGDGSITDTGDFTVDVVGDLILDAAGDDILLKSAGTHEGNINLASSNLTIKSIVSDKDIIFQGNDGGSGITALTLDMSAAGAATFNNDVTAFSDKRLKKDIEPIEHALKMVMQMQGVYYKRNDIEDAKEQVGVLAQDMEAILPEVVLTADDEMQTKSVDYGKLTSVLIEAIKEIKSEIDKLKGV